MSKKLFTERGEMLQDNEHKPVMYAIAMQDTGNRYYIEGRGDETSSEKEARKELADAAPYEKLVLVKITYEIIE